MTDSDLTPPPRWPLKILTYLLRKDYLEELSGDLEERFRDNADRFTLRKAKRLYALDSLKLLRPSLLKSPGGDYKLNHFGMFKNHFKIAIRNFKKHTSHSLINTIGLAISLACCVLVGIYLQHEVSYDKHFNNSDRIYRYTREFLNTDGSTLVHLAALAPPFIPYLKEDFPEMEAITSFNIFSAVLKIDEQFYVQRNLVQADENLFRVFQLDFISGDPLTALVNPRSVVLSEKTAIKYFKSTDVLGETLHYEQDGQEYTLKVTGVIRETPENTHFKMEMIVDFSFVEEQYESREALMKHWSENIYFTYFLLKEGRSVEEMEQRFPDFLAARLDEKANEWTALHTQKLTDIHLHSHLDSEVQANGNITHVYSFAIIGLMILIISMINYMNLTTAMSMNRAKEVGMRKVMGAGRSGIIGQFITESVVMVFLAVMVAIILAHLLLPYLGKMTGNSYDQGLIVILRNLALISGSGILIGLLSGVYPALVVSGFKPLNALKSRFSISSGSGNFRRSLVIIQFTISSILILGTGIIFKQLAYIRDKDLGFEKDNTLIIYMNRESAAKDEAFKKSLLTHSSVLSYGTSNRLPSTQLTSFSSVETEVNGDMVAPEASIKNIRVDASFLNSYGIELAAGRYFNEDITTDSSGYILNEAAVKMIGWPSNDEAIGKRMNYSGKPGHVIGVIKNIHFESLESKISPMVFLLTKEPLGVLSVRLNGENLRKSVGFIEDQWDSFFPGQPIEYQFLDERFNELYEAEARRAEVFTALSFIAIFIACLGLLGLASFTVSRRAKEVGIRKVLGASVQQILMLLSREFLLLVLISFFIGFPVAFYFTEQWLAGYAYRIEIGVLPFVITGVLCLLMALLAVSSRTLKVARNNPVESLRDE